MSRGQMWWTPYWKAIRTQFLDFFTQFLDPAWVLISCWYSQTKNNRKTLMLLISSHMLHWFLSYSLVLAFSTWVVIFGMEFSVVESSQCVSLRMAWLTQSSYSCWQLIFLKPRSIPAKLIKKWEEVHLILLLHCLHVAFIATPEHRSEN